MKTISPREQFQKSPAATAFADIVSNPIFSLGIETALMQFVMNQAAPDRLETAAYRQHELQGAKQFVDILINLCTVPEPAAKTSNINLEWQHKPHLGPPQPKARPPVLPPQSFTQVGKSRPRKATE